MAQLRSNQGGLGDGPYRILWIGGLVAVIVIGIVVAVANALPRTSAAPTATEQETALESRLTPEQRAARDQAERRQYEAGLSATEQESRGVRAQPGGRGD
jgi:hypothetical protein